MDLKRYDASQASAVDGRKKSRGEVRWMRKRD